VLGFRIEESSLGIGFVLIKVKAGGHSFCINTIAPWRILSTYGSGSSIWVVSIKFRKLDESLTGNG